MPTSSRNVHGAYMKGLELARRYYLEFGAPMIHAEFPELEDVLATGLAGAGSECFGYDDEISRDHDFEPGFCIFIPDDLDRGVRFRLERAYAKLPREFMGFERQPVSPVGGNRHGVIARGDFFRARTGRPDGMLTMREWLRIPDPYLAEVVNGEVFRDVSGTFTAIRERLAHMPEDVRRKKLAGALLLMAQSGQYNYPRAVSRGEAASAQLAAFEFVRHTMGAAFALSYRYMPYYKWRFRAFGELPCLSHLCDALEYLITTDNDKATAKVKYEVIGDIACAVADELRRDALSDIGSDDLERHAYSCNDKIADPDVRNLNILYAVE